MALLAMCMPILAGKKEKWQAMMDQVANDPNFAASRTDAGVHERSFLQETPAGDFVILTFEGDDLQNFTKALICSSSSLILFQTMYSYVTIFFVLEYQYLIASFSSSNGKFFVKGMILFLVFSIAE